MYSQLPYFGACIDLVSFKTFPYSSRIGFKQDIEMIPRKLRTGECTTDQAGISSSPAMIWNHISIGIRRRIRDEVKVYAKWILADLSYNRHRFTLWYCRVPCANFKKLWPHYRWRSDMRSSIAAFGFQVVPAKFKNVVNRIALLSSDKYVPLSKLWFESKEL